MTIDQLIDQLVTEGGAIVSSSACSEMEIADAQATGRFSVREDGMGFVRRYAEWLALQFGREKAKKAYCGALRELAEKWEAEASRIDSDTGEAYPDQDRAEADLAWGSAAGLRKAADELRGILAEIGQTRIQLSDARKGCPKCGSWRFMPSVSGNDGYCETCHERVPIPLNSELSKP